MNDIIEQYYNSSNYASVNKIYKLMKDDNHDVKPKDIKNFIENKTEVQLLKQNKNSKMKLGHITSMKPHAIWNMDIFFLQKYHKQNQGYKYILCCIDIFTRYVFCEPMISKENEEVIKAFKLIIKKQKPYVIVTDNDSTFLSSEFQRVLDENKIALDPVPVHDHHSLGVIDRFARTLKTILHKRFIKYNSLNWIDHLDSIIKNYNNSPHSGIDNIKPSQATEKHNAAIIYELNVEKAKVKTTYKPTIFEIGDYVRVKINDKFSKKSEGTYQDEINRITNIDGKMITLDNNKKVKYDMILKVNQPNENELPRTKNIIKKAKKAYQTELLHKRIDIQPENIIQGPRIRRANPRYN